MLILPPVPDDDQSKPAFNDAASCSSWLSQLQLTNLHQAHGILRTQLDELNRSRLQGLVRLQIVELLRETVAFVQTEYAKKLIAKKLPLAEEELTIFVSIVTLWQEMITGYMHCLRDFIGGDRQLADSGALLCQRSMTYSGQQIFEHLRSSYDFNNIMWKQLHALYTFSEKNNLHLVECRDDLVGESPTTCQAAYIKTLLACHAHPAELTRRQLQMMNSWLSMWSPAVTISEKCVAGTGEAPPLVVNIYGSQGLMSLHYAAQSSGNRYLAMMPLSKLLRVKTILLQQGQSPAQLELGSGYPSADCISLLKLLHLFWCEEASDRMAERHKSTLHAEVCYGIESVYAQIANKPFKRPGKKAGMDTVSRRQIETLGQAFSADNRQGHASHGFAMEKWQVENFSILGVRLLRDEIKGERIGLQELVALRMGESKQLTLGSVKWTQVTRTGQLQAGLNFLPGEPQAVILNHTGINPALTEKSCAALLLPAVVEMKSPSSLIIPRNLFKPEQIVEIVFQDNTKKKVRMKLSVEYGLNFERVSFIEV